MRLDALRQLLALPDDPQMPKRGHVQTLSGDTRHADLASHEWRKLPKQTAKLLRAIRWRKEESA